MWTWFRGGGGCYSSSGQRKKGLFQKHSLAFPIPQGQRAPYTFTLAAHGPGAGAELFTSNDSLQGSNLVPLAYKTQYQIPCAGMEDWASQHSLKENKKVEWINLGCNYNEKKAWESR